MRCGRLPVLCVATEPDTGGQLCVVGGSRTQASAAKVRGQIRFWSWACMTPAVLDPEEVVYPSNQPPEPRSVRLWQWAIRGCTGRLPLEHMKMLLGLFVAEKKRSLRSVPEKSRDTGNSMSCLDALPRAVPAHVTEANYLRPRTLPFSLPQGVRQRSSIFIGREKLRSPASTSHHTTRHRLHGRKAAGRSTSLC